MRIKPFAFVAVAVLAASAQAQPHPAGHHGAGAQQHAPGPYAGMQSRAVKALSETQMAELRAGKGMALALPAELNGYPGPAHVLELAEPLRLSPAQKTRTQQLFEQMQREAKAVSEDLIAAETALDALFRNRQATTASLQQATTAAATTQGKLRETHLRYHLVMMEVLTPEQVAAYNRLRGY
jgi:Spy/CpxP family protein refolding chaperone